MLRYCVDLDATLARYERGDADLDLFRIGDPLPGSQDFVKRLSEHVGNDGQKARIIIFTRRMSDERLTNDGRSFLYQAITNWLANNDFVWHEIYYGKGKPDGTAFIDDRGVQCRPQENPNAYEEAETYIKNVILGW